MYGLWHFLWQAGSNKDKFDQQGDFQSAISQNRDISYQGL